MMIEPQKRTLKDTIRIARNILESTVNQMPLLQHERDGILEIIQELDEVLELNKEETTKELGELWDAIDKARKALKGKEMAKYRQKLVIVEATQWFKNGDHPQDKCHYIDDKSPDRFLSEGKIVRYYRDPDDDGQRKCGYCGRIMHDHGWVDTLEGGHIVCPGDWIITGVKGEYYPCKPDIFEATYELVEGKGQKSE